MMCSWFRAHWSANLDEQIISLNSWSLWTADLVVQIISILKSMRMEKNALVLIFVDLHIHLICLCAGCAYVDARFMVILFIHVSVCICFSKYLLDINSSNSVSLNCYSIFYFIVVWLFCLIIYIFFRCLYGGCICFFLCFEYFFLSIFGYVFIFYSPYPRIYSLHNCVWNH